MRVRQSMISTWMSCSLQARFQHLDLLPRQQNAKASFGTVIHHVIDQMNHGMALETAINEFFRLWANPELLGVAPDYYPKRTSFQTLRNQGVEILTAYHEKHKWEKRKILASEHRFLVPFGEHEIEGTVDFLELRKDGKGNWTVFVCDLKTNSVQPNLNTLHLNIQFTAYIWASMQREFWVGNGPDFPGVENGEQWYEDLKGCKRKGIWIQLMAGGKEINVGDRDDDDFMRLYRCVQEIEKAIKYDVYVPNISGTSCVYCSYTEPCGVRIPTEVEIRERNN